MALPIDQNLPHDLERQMADAFPGVVHVRSLGMERSSDTALWREGRERSLAIRTRDSDFRHRSAVLGHPPKVVLVRRGNCSTMELSRLLTAATPAPTAFLNDPDSPLLCID